MNNTPRRRFIWHQGGGRRFRCGTYWLQRLWGLTVAVASAVFFAVFLTLPTNLQPAVTAVAFAVSGAAVCGFGRLVTVWFLRVDPRGQQVEIRRGRKRRCFAFEEIALFEIPSEPQGMPRNVTLLLADGGRVICPFVSQGAFVRPRGLDRLVSYLNEVGVEARSITGPPVPPFPRVVRHAD